ncbi:DUF4365 domain-containing protein [Brevibacillus sp. HB1.1]|uniref:DUF4365 domain-containing protein n=1 Tax=Brevibacillus sp. HB1.1 TaxID=2738808 RepID=UPI0015754505|nr:DUF4365 domain-containing protein [Brevibacillus sp. HB1.1]NTU28830.1 DUF4365 domain-containing protein [Brevibacillus sp. HB1.1]
MQRKLPQVPHTTKIGYSASELLISVLGMFSNVVPIPTEKDLGIDMRAELLSGSIPVGMHYNIQCKGTEDVIIDEKNIAVIINVTTINYWLQQKEPTFLVVVDRITQKFYWTYPFHQVESRIEDIQSQETVTIHVSKTSFFEYNIKMLPPEMMDIIHQYEYKILEKLTKVLSKNPIDSQKLGESSYEEAISINNVIKERTVEDIDIDDDKKKIITEIFMLENEYGQTDLFKHPSETDNFDLSKTRVLINELLVDFYDISSALSRAGITSFKGFGLPSDETEPPTKLVLSFGMGVQIRLLQKIIQILSDYQLEYIDFVDYRQEDYDEYLFTVAIGTDSYNDTNLSLIKIDTELLEKLLDPLISANNFYAFLIQDVEDPCIDW